MTQNDSTFSPEQYASAYPSSMQDHYWSLARCACVFDLLRKTGLETHKILEIGCGTGIVVANLQSRQLDIKGCELSEISDQALLTRNITTGISAFDLPKAERDSYKAILLLDVLEHLEQRADFLDKIYSHFSNAENLIITVPARSELWSNYDDFYGHKLRYDRQTMRDEIAKTKWELLKNDYFFHSIYWPARALLRMKKHRNIKLGGPVGPIKIVHRFLAAIFALEARIVPGQIVGTSLLVHLRRGS